MRTQNYILFKDILKSIVKESAYNLSDVNTIKGKSFEEVLAENEGAPFDIHEKRKFLEKQETFGGTGKVEFIIKKSTNEISAQIFVNGSTNNYVFKKLPNKKHVGLYNYVCFISLKSPENKPEEMNKAESGGDENNKKEPNQEENNDIVYILSNIFNDTKIEEKLSILSDFISRINSYGL